MDDFTQGNLAVAFAENRQWLSALAAKKLNPILLKRMSAEDVLSEAYINAAKAAESLAVALTGANRINVNERMARK